MGRITEAPDVVIQHCPGVGIVYLRNLCFCPKCLDGGRTDQIDEAWEWSPERLREYYATTSRMLPTRRAGKD